MWACTSLGTNGPPTCDTARFASRPGTVQTVRYAESGLPTALRDRSSSRSRGLRWLFPCRVLVLRVESVA